MTLEQFPVLPPVAASQTSVEVLVVDDDERLRKAVARTLKADGMQVEEAEGGEAALAKLATRRFDVVVSDVDMPGGSGLDLLRAVRAVDLDLPVILLTGVMDVRAAAKALEYGAFRYEVKPVDFERLIANIRLAARAHALARLRRDAVAAAGSDEQVAADRAGLEVRFQSAVDKLWIAYQPIVGARSGAMFGVEALMRTEEPSLPHPGAVLDAATRLGRLRELGQRIRRFAAEGLAHAQASTFLFVNLHPEDLFDDDLLRDDSPLTRIASRVVLEITERASLASTPALQEKLAALRALGFRFAIDDIGAGYSGLSSFADVMPEVVKIDMALVRGVHGSVIRQRTIRALATLCHESGSLVVGEGVETAEERDCLRKLGCDLFQGYLFARPARELPRWRSSETLAALNRSGTDTIIP
jgi:EAL domain-containing protein (putative c-di-GMP-specific phosphodiesterase class I)